jgi:patatin-related protein
MAQQKREELRLALVMNGGVSLAVWMGGVTNEIFRLVTDQHPVYSMLLDLTRTNARVDVISGTSAGGVNGAALAVALLYGGDFYRVRSVWLETGSLSDLLRPALSENPGSLLMGDEYFLPAICDALHALARSNKPIFDAKVMPLDMQLTTTLLTGRQGNSVDDLSVPVHDVDYRAYFHFQHKSAVSDFAQADAVIPKLARAARSTASFPLAFEPSLVSVEEGQGLLKDSEDKELKTPRYVIDGGILDNRPFRGARQAIFRMPRRGGVRRVLAYINPDPGDGPPGTPGSQSPSLATVLTESILGIPQSQSIADQLTAIDDHNEAVRVRRNSVLTMVESFDANTLRDLAGKLYPVYRKRRLASTFDLFVYGLLGDAVPQFPNVDRDLLSIGKHGREQMLSAFMDVKWSEWIPLDWPSQPDNRAYAKESWSWGLFPVEFAAGVMLDLLRITQSLADYIEPPDTDRFRREYRNAAEPPRAAASGDWQDPNAPRKSAPGVSGDGASAASVGSAASVASALWNSLLGRGAGQATRTWAPETLRMFLQSELEGEASRPALARYWDCAYGIVDRLAALRESEKPIWRQNTVQLMTALRKFVGTPDGPERVMNELRDHLFPEMFAFLGTPERQKKCADLAYEIAGLIRDASQLAGDIARTSSTSGRLRRPDVAAAQGLLQLTQHLGYPASVEPRDTLFTLMQLEVAEFSFNDHDPISSDTLIELVQISGDSQSPLTLRGEPQRVPNGPFAAKQKLLGLQLAHFAAFYRRSWRENDWIFGRLDGSERLVKLLLNPERLNCFYFGERTKALADIKHIALDSVDSPVLHEELCARWKELGLEERIERELGFLDTLDHQLPDVLPWCAAAITLRLHYGILREELPELVSAIHFDQALGAESSGSAEGILRGLVPVPGAEGRPGAAPFSPEQARARFEDGLLGKDRLGAEAGSDLFTRTLAHVAATLQGALSGQGAKLGPVSLFFATLKLPILGFYFVANGLTRQSRTSAAFNGGILAVGTALVALQFVWSPADLAARTVPSTIVSIGWALFAYGLIMSVARAPRTIGLALLLGFAWYARSGQSAVLALVACASILMAASIRWPRLQWAVGFCALLACALWGSGWFAAGPSGKYESSVLVFAAAVAFAILLAVIQSSRSALAFERWLRLVFKRVLH